MEHTTKAIVDRIASLEESIRMATEYLESGKHADWHGFRPLFARKFKDGKEQPPHKDWVKNVYLRGITKSLNRAEKVLQQLERESAARSAG